jgi:hypothetical protein
MVIVNPAILPAVSAGASSTLVCQGFSTALLGAGANTYSWSPAIFNGQVFMPSSSAYIPLWVQTQRQHVKTPPRFRYL